MVEEADREPANLPAAGNDYAFASPQSGNGCLLLPTVVKQRTRCAFCHEDQDLTKVITLAIALPPKEGSGSFVRQLNPAAYEVPEFRIGR
jgi:hypothetical protein